MSDIRILIADEDMRYRTSLRKMLESAGYLIVGDVNDGMSALSMIRQIRPDLALIDTRLAQLDGLAVARMLRDEDLLPVIMTTTHSSREMVMQAREAGVLGYLVKPLKADELMPIIEVTRVRWLEKHARKRELYQLRDKIETRRVIERAKGYLMDSQGLHEAEAFRKIQRLAMNSRRTMREVAQAILLAQQIRP
jgi:response regulator NasT